MNNRKTLRAGLRPLTLALHTDVLALFRGFVARRGTSIERELAQALSEFLEVVEDQEGHDGYEPKLYGHVKETTTYLPRDLYDQATEAARRMMVPLTHVVRFAVELKVGATVRTESVVEVMG